MMTGLIRLRPLTHMQRCLRGLNSPKAATVILAGEGSGPQHVEAVAFSSFNNCTTG